MQKKEIATTKKLVIMAMLAAISIVLASIVHFPTFLPFLEYDPADISIFIGTFMFGPLSGLLLTTVTAIIQGLTVSAGGGFIGIIMHIAATGAFVIVFGLITKTHDSMKFRLIALSIGVLTMTAVMIIMNIILTPIFMQVTRQMVIDLILPAFLPFNLIKAGVNAALAFILFHALDKVLPNGLKRIA